MNNFPTNIQLLRTLRARTSAGITNCQTALQNNNYDLEKATIWLRRQGLNKSANTAEKLLNGGRIDVFVAKNRALLLHFSCQTDFVANNKKFQETFTNVGNLIVNSNATTLSEALIISDSAGEKVAQKIALLSSILGEKISLEKIEILTATNKQFFGKYTHTNGKAAALILFEGIENFVLGEKIAMHIVVSRPIYIDQNSIPANYLKNEKMILKKEVASKFSSKSENLQLIILENKLKSQIMKITLVNQFFIHDEKKSVGEIMLTANIKALAIASGLATN